MSKKNKKDKKDTTTTNSSIKCEVESCKHNNCDDGYCSLDEIKVGCTCNNDECSTTDETICQSFEKTEETDSTDDIDSDEERITDTTYEVEAEYDDENEEVDEEKED